LNLLASWFHESIPNLAEGLFYPLNKHFFVIPRQFVLPDAHDFPTSGA